MNIQRSAFGAFLLFASATSFTPGGISSYTQTFSDAEFKVMVTSQNNISNKRRLTSKKNLPVFALRRLNGVQANNDSFTRYMTSDDSMDHDVDEPLANGVDSVNWLPTVIGAKSSEPDSNEDTDVLPLFPLGGMVYTPNSEHTLNIFEPRYRKMYNDILMNGSKRFVVAMSHPSEKGRFAEIGVLFELQDLKEVSEQTNDQVKYICSHRVTGRVKLHKILNPSAWETRETYLKVEGKLLDVNAAGPTVEFDEANVDDVYSRLVEKTTAVYEEAAPKEEGNLKESFKNLVELQQELEEDVRFTLASIDTLAVSPGDKDEGIWSTIRLWQSYSEQRLVARQNELQREFQDKLLKFLTKEKGVKEEELPSAIGFTELSPALQKEVQDLQKRMSVELEPLVLESTLAMQKILEAANHKERVILLKFFIDAERKRLEARKLLQGMFIPSDDTDETEDETVDIEAVSMDDSEKGPGSIFTDEPDAFQ